MDLLRLHECCQLRACLHITAWAAPIYSTLESAHHVKYMQALSKFNGRRHQECVH